MSVMVICEQIIEEKQRTFSKTGNISQKEKKTVEPNKGTIDFNVVKQGFIRNTMT